MKYATSSGMLERARRAAAPLALACGLGAALPAAA
ncbi:META domain-containing protein, partial [Sphingomonas sp. ABOLE]